MENMNELFIGRLGAYPQLKYTKNQKAVCHLSVAQKIEGSESPKWRKVVVWGKQAEQCNLYLKKGQEIVVQGLKNINQYKSKENEIKEFEEIVARFVGISIL